MIDESVKIGAPTHYSATFDERGQPYAGTPASIGAADIGGELPQGWDGQFWDWQPRHDPAGKWVQLADKKRAALWRAVKAAAAQTADAGVTVTAGNRTVRIDSDEASANRLARAAGRGAPRTWTLADNTGFAASPAQLRTMADAVNDHRAAVHARAQQIRAEIFAPANDSLEKLAAIDLSF